MFLGQLWGGTVVLLAAVGALAIIGLAWAFQRLWMLVRLELLIESKKSELALLTGKIETAVKDCADAEQRRRAIIKRTPPEFVPEVPAITTPPLAIVPQRNARS